MKVRAGLWFVLVVSLAFAAVGSALRAAPNRGQEGRPEDVVLTGRLVDLQSFMTGKFSGTDPAKACQDSIRAGVPTGIQTEDGLVIVGMGERGPGRLLVPHALKNVEIKGKLYEKDGVQYVDMVSIQAGHEDQEEPEAHEEHEEENPDEPAADEDEEP